MLLYSNDEVLQIPAWRASRHSLKASARRHHERDAARLPAGSRVRTRGRGRRSSAAMAGDVGSAARRRPWKSIINSFGVSQATIPSAISLPSAPRATPAFIVFHFHETHDNTE